MEHSIPAPAADHRLWRASRVALLLSSATLLLALLAAWRWTPLAEWVTAEHVLLWMDRYTHSPLAAGWVALAYVLASITLFPRPLVTLGVSIAFGPWLGTIYALTGIVVAALSHYALGRSVKREVVRRLAGERLDALSEILKRHGLIAVIVLRVLPLGPFVMVNVIAGAIRLRPMHFTLATLIGMAPGVIVMTVFGGKVSQHLRSQGDANWWIAGFLVLAAAFFAYHLHRWSRRKFAALRSAQSRNC